MINDTSRLLELIRLYDYYEELCDRDAMQDLSTEIYEIYDMTMSEAHEFRATIIEVQRLRNGNMM